MKKTKKIISLILTIQMLLACALIPGVMATDMVIEMSAIGIESSEELSPMMSARCGNTCTHDDMVYDHSEEKDGETQALWTCSCGHTEWMPVN